MKRNDITGLFIFLVSIVAASLSTAFAQGQPHVHGIAQLVLVQEGSRLQIEFTSPAINIVGFEHSPQNDTQRRAVDEALQTLAGADSILLLGSLDCDLDSAQATATGQFSAHGDEHDHHHDHDHDSNHAGFKVELELSCSDAPLPAELVVNAFNNFSNLEGIDAMWALETSQGAQQLSRHNGRLRLRQ